MIDIFEIEIKRYYNHQKKILHFEKRVCQNLVTVYDGKTSTQGYRLKKSEIGNHLIFYF